MKEKLMCAGSLENELEEMEKIFLNEDSVVAPASAMTDPCAILLTILCC